MVRAVRVSCSDDNSAKPWRCKRPSISTVLLTLRRWPDHLSWPNTACRAMRWSAICRDTCDLSGILCGAATTAGIELMHRKSRPAMAGRDEIDIAVGSAAIMVDGMIGLVRALAVADADQVPQDADLCRVDAGHVRRGRYCALAGCAQPRLKRIPEANFSEAASAGHLCRPESRCAF